MAAFTCLSLFSGVGALGLGIKIAVPEARCVCYVEIEAPAVETLAARFKDGSLEDAPVWSDIRTFDGRPWRGKVALIEGGFPCQDISVAGKRAGLSGKRSGLWGEYQRVIGEVEPEFVFIENVGGLVSSLTLLHRSDIMGHLEGLLAAAVVAATPKERWYIERHHERLYRRLLPVHGISALLYVQCSLGAMGYESEAGFFSAAEAGAAHKRERVFVLGYKPGTKLPVAYRQGGGRGILRQSPGSAGLADRSHAELDNADGRGRQFRFEGATIAGGYWAHDGVPEQASDELGYAESHDERRNTVPRTHGQGLAPGGSGGQLGHTEEPGLPREPQGWLSRGLPDGSREFGGELADAAHNGRECGARGDSVGRYLLPAVEGVQCGGESGAGEPERRIGDVADAEYSERRPEPAEHTDAHGRPGSRWSGAELGHSDLARLEGRDIGGHSAAERAAGQTGRELADTGRECDERRREPPELGEPCEPTEGETQQRQWGGDAAGDSLPLFAPGPGAAELWRSILGEHPELAPAISEEEVESILCGISSGAAAQLDFEDRTDRLRSLGNLACPIQAACAFTVLATRAGIIVGQRVSRASPAAAGRAASVKTVLY